MTTLHKSDTKKLTIELLQEQSYSYLSPESLESERQNCSEVILQSHLKTAIDALNPTIPKNPKEQAWMSDRADAL